MERLTYAQAKSKACVMAKTYKTYVLVFKNAGGNFDYKSLFNSKSIAYTKIKSLVCGDGSVIVSRETIANILEQFNINMIYIQL